MADIRWEDEIVDGEVISGSVRSHLKNQVLPRIPGRMI